MWGVEGGREERNVPFLDTLDTFSKKVQMLRVYAGRLQESLPIRLLVPKAMAAGLEVNRGHTKQRGGK
jgi:hypothetical protein